MLSFILIQNRQQVSRSSNLTGGPRCADWVNRGKTRLAKWYVPYSDEEKIRVKGEASLSLLFLLPPSTPD